MHSWRQPGDGDRQGLQLLDDLALPIFLLDRELTVLEHNEAADELIAQHSGLRIEDRRLRVFRTEEHEALVRAVDAAVEASSATAFIVEISDGKGPRLHLCLHTLVGYRATGVRVRLVLYVIDPRYQPNLDGQLLRRVYGLSPGEIRIVRELMQGQSVESIAKLLSISVYTVRTHLKNLFAKTGTSRQGVLIARIAAAVGCLRITVENRSFERCATSERRVDSETSRESSGIRDASRDS
jgi:DNA-binding CsgD family transcriptional regulator